MSSAAITAALATFREVWLMDFEFIATPGERPDPICCVAHELRSGRTVRLWDADMRTAGSPVGVDALLVAYYAPAELTCFLALGWPLPTGVLDLYAEFRNFGNGRDGALGIRGASLLAALAYFGLSHLDPEQKAGWRDRILQGRPYSAADRLGILDYCGSDVAALAHLLPALGDRLHQARPQWFAHALLRGRYMRAVALMEHRGVPLDTPLLSRLVTHWDGIKAELVRTICADYPIFEGTSLRMARFESWLIDQRIPWPRTESGRLSLSEDTFKAMVKAYPVVAPIREVRANLGKLRLADLAVGRDGRNRTLLSPLRARSGRNAPSASGFIFGPSVWLRGLIKPEPGRALAYIDFASQEIGIAAALSGDTAMLRAHQSGDPYIAFAIDAGLVPAEATKATHKAVRDRCKALVLGTLYGMQEKTLAGNLNAPTAEARELLRAHRCTYARFWQWSQAAIDTAMLSGHLDTCFGWRLHIGPDTKPTSLLNHPMQSNGAEMLRLACSLMIEAGVQVCAPIHDAVLIEAPIGEIEAAVGQAQTLMRKAARIVTGGLEIGADAEIVRYPDRYRDARGVEMWDRVVAILAKMEAAEPAVLAA